MATTRNLGLTLYTSADQFVDGATGEVTHKKLITYALNTGRSPAQLFPDSRR